MPELVLVREDLEDYVQSDQALINTLLSDLSKEPNSAKVKLINSYFDKLLLLSNKENAKLLKKNKQLNE